MSLRGINSQTGQKGFIKQKKFEEITANTSEINIKQFKTESSNSIDRSTQSKRRNICSCSEEVDCKSIGERWEALGALERIRFCTITGNGPQLKYSYPPEFVR